MAAKITASSKMKESDAKKSGKDDIRQSLASVSMHGVNKVMNATDSRSKMFWVMTCILAIATLIIFSKHQVERYLEFETTVVVDNKEFVGNVIFPSVTVCSPVSLNKTKVAEMTWLHDVLEYDPQSQTVNSTVVAGADPRRIKIVLAAFVNMTEKDLMELVPGFNDIVISCAFEVFGGCHEAAFLGYFDHRFGRCFTFNSAQNREPFVVANPGRYCAVTLELFADKYQMNFIKGVNVHPSESNNIYVRINQPDHPPGSLGDTGFYAPLEKITTVAVKRKVVTRLEAPYQTMCKNGASEEARLLDAHTYGRPGLQYYHDTCLSTCFLAMSLGMCGCSKYDLHLPQDLREVPALSHLHLDVAKPVCDFRSVQAKACVSRAWALYLANAGSTCNCPPRCKEEIYETRISSGKWQASQDTVKLFRQIHPNKENLTDEKIISSMAKLEVFYETFQHDTIKHNPAYGSGDLMSDIGGLIGLFVGLSIITVVEFAEIVGNLILKALWVKKSNLSQHKQQTNRSTRSLSTSTIENDYINCRTDYKHTIGKGQALSSVNVS